MHHWLLHTNLLRETQPILVGGNSSKAVRCIQGNELLWKLQLQLNWQPYSRRRCKSQKRETIFSCKIIVTPYGLYRILLTFFFHSYESFVLCQTNLKADRMARFRLRQQHLSAPLSQLSKGQMHIIKPSGAQHLFVRSLPRLTRHKDRQDLRLETDMAKSICMDDSLR